MARDESNWAKKARPEYWGADDREQIGAALITAQNALTGYWNLSNGPGMEQHHISAQMALDDIREAIRVGRILEQQGIIEGRGR